ncbi:putative TdLSC37 protein [Hordeum vulgare]|nr:putative TdLSC37 protein [Hordeum vulgare]
MGRAASGCTSFRIASPGPPHRDFVSVGSVASTLFWFDCWADENPFAARFPDLFAIAVEPRISVEVALIDLGRLAFRRTFGPMEVLVWHELLDCIALHEPDVEQSFDRLSWRLEPSGSFFTKSLYQAIAPTAGPEPLASIWSTRLPMKIRIFLLQWIHGRVPSGVKVLKRNGPGDGLCLLCGTEEDSNYLVFSCVSPQFFGVVSVKWSADLGATTTSRTSSSNSRLCLQYPPH